jgi:hypothetical protein
MIDPGHLRRLERYASTSWLSSRPTVPHREAVRAMRAADVLLVVTLSQVHDSAPNMTGKIFECLAARRPILLIGPPSAARTLLESTQAGAWADPEVPGSVESGLNRALAMASDPSYRGVESVAIEPYDRRRQATRWSAVLGRVIQGSDREQAALPLDPQSEP